MNILYVGPYRQDDGWGYDSKGIATALQELYGENLSIRPVYLSNIGFQGNNIEHLYEAEKRRLDHYDVLIEHTLPAASYYYGYIPKRIVILNLDFIIPRTWTIKLNLMDKVIALSPHGKNLLLESGVSQEKACNISAPYFISSDDVTHVNLGPQRFGHRFYTKSSSDIKSGIKQLLIGYLSEFTVVDNVILLIACPLHEAAKMSEMIRNIKQELGIFQSERKYPQIGIINSDDDRVMNALSTNCHTLVDLSYNGTVTREMMRAATKKRNIVALDITKFQHTTHEIASDYISISYANRPIPGLYTSREKWYIPNIDSIKSTLREIYNSSELPDMFSSVVDEINKPILQELAGHIEG